MEYFKRGFYILASKELTFWKKGEFLTQCLTASDNYDCGCLAARSWIHWPLHFQVYFCCLLASLPLTPGISICKILSSVSGCLSTFLRKKGFFFIFPFSQLVLSRITAKGRLQTWVKPAFLLSALIENIKTIGTNLEVCLLMILEVQEKF